VRIVLPAALKQVLLDDWARAADAAAPPPPLPRKPCVDAILQRYLECAPGSLDGPGLEESVRGPLLALEGKRASRSPCMGAGLGGPAALVPAALFSRAVCLCRAWGSVWVSKRVGLPPASACAARCTWLLCGCGVFWQRPAGL